MKFTASILSASILAALCVAVPVHAQDTGTADANGKNDSSKVTTLATIKVVGLRQSLKKSLETERNSDAIINVITAEDIGKFPATNVAEALAQMPGVTIDRVLGATQRVSIDGMDPSLNLSFLDGHPVAQALWLYGDSPNRGFNYSLLPPEILGNLEIYKSPEARLPSGSIGGTIIMHTLEPLNLPANTLRASVGYNYNDMVSKGKPDVSLIYSWKNKNDTWGIDVAAEHYEQITNRQGEEIFGYTPVSSIAAVNPAVATQIANGQIQSTAIMPNEINSANFQQTEKRTSFVSNIQFRPNNQFDATLGLMYLRDQLNNYNQSMYAFPTWLTPTQKGIGGLVQGPNGVIIAGSQCDPSTQPTCPTGAAGATIFDNNAREATVTTKGVNLHLAYHGYGWELHGQAGVSSSHDPITQAFIEADYFGGFNWSQSQGFNFSNPTAAENPSNWAGYGGFMGNYASEPYYARDNWAQANFSYDLDGFFDKLLVGVRYHVHHEGQTLDVYTGVPVASLAQVGAGPLTNLSGLSSMNFFPGAINHVQPSGPGAIYQYVLSTPGLFNNLYPPYVYDDTFGVAQKSEAGYIQADFSNNDNLRGNVGVRFVHTVIDSSGFVVNQSQVNSLPPPPGSYQTVGNAHDNILPSFNIAYNLTPDVILRGAAAETIAWAPYNQETPYTETNDTVLTGTGGNAHLDPYKSYNFNTSVAWYFNDQSVLAFSLFYKNLTNYITQGTSIEPLFNSIFDTAPAIYALFPAGTCNATGICNYSIIRPENGGRANAKGLEISYQQPFAHTGFGLRTNLTYSDGSTKTGGPLPYNSKLSYTLSPYFEKGPLTASVTYSWQSKYLAGGYVAGAPSAMVAPWAELDLDATYQFSHHFSVSFDALNLLDSTYKEYAEGNPTEIYARYKSGREYLARLNYKF
ncbi:MAG: TonB-dependent receptor [Pseudomonadota bacterium]|nr:TonB-dependent receptor [Pseudomonadota bacterium]